MDLKFSIIGLFWVGKFGKFFNLRDHEDFHRDL